jgi:ribonuclease-3 family protein
MPPEPEALPPLPHSRALAFLGDAVFELFLREQAVAQGFSHSGDLHRFTSARAKASAQVAVLHQLQPHLTDAEREIVRQGRNVGVAQGRRATQADHRLASALEALLGALYLRDRERLAALLEVIGTFPLPEPDVPDEDISAESP